MHQIFVYGTLLKGMYNYEIYCSAEDSYRQKAYVCRSGFLFGLFTERRFARIVQPRISEL